MKESSHLALPAVGLTMTRGHMRQLCLFQMPTGFATARTATPLKWCLTSGSTVAAQSSAPSCAPWIGKHTLHLTTTTSFFYPKTISTTLRLRALRIRGLGFSKRAYIVIIYNEDGRIRV